MKLSKQHSQHIQQTLPTPDVPIHQRQTLIELLTTLAVIGVLIFDKRGQ